MCYISSASVDPCDCPPNCELCEEVIGNWYDDGIWTDDSRAVCDECIEANFSCFECKRPFDLKAAMERGPLDWGNDENICPECATKLADEGNDPADPKNIYALA